MTADAWNLASLNVCRAVFGLGSSVAMPAAAGMIGTMFPQGRKRTYAFVAVSCGELTISGIMLIELT
jgi:MFS family permease